MLHLVQTIENQDFEMALLQMWYQLDGCAQPPCYGLQPTASHISRFVWNNIHIFIQNRDN
jgi:hypothetical protein